MQKTLAHPHKMAHGYLAYRGGWFSFPQMLSGSRSENRSTLDEILLAFLGTAAASDSRVLQWTLRRIRKRVVIELVVWVYFVKPFHSFFFARTVQELAKRRDVSKDPDVNLSSDTIGRGLRHISTSCFLRFIFTFRCLGQGSPFYFCDSQGCDRYQAWYFMQLDSLSLARSNPPPIYYYHRPY